MAMRAKSQKPSGFDCDRLRKNFSTRINTPQQAATATVGVGRRSRTSRRSHSPRSSRSLSRNKTDSELNWSMAQRMDSRQDVERNQQPLPARLNRLPVIALQNAPQQKHHSGNRDQAGAQVQLHAGRHGQYDQRHGHQQQGHKVILPFLGAAGEGRQRQAQGAEKAETGTKAISRATMAVAEGMPKPGNCAATIQPVSPMLTRFSTAVMYAEEHDGDQLAQHDFACARRGCKAAFPACRVLFRRRRDRRPGKRRRSRPKSAAGRGEFWPTSRLRAARASATSALSTKNGCVQALRHAALARLASPICSVHRTKTPISRAWAICDLSLAELKRISG